VNPEGGLFPDATTVDKVRYGGSSVGDRLNVAGQNESSRLFGHKGAASLAGELRLAAAK